MALRIAKGMFRLWLVLSGLWVGGMALETWRELAYLIPADMRWEYIQFNAEVALIPPIFVFVVASTFGWAFRGFRQ
jgi:hypothetical protein